METKSNKQKKRENTKLDLEQYKIMIEIYNEEVTRFYNRQNIYITFQLIIFAGMVSGIEKLLKYPMIFRFGILLMVIISLFSTLLCKRGYDIQNIIIKTISKFEEENKNLRLLKEIHKTTSSSGFFVIKNMNFQSLAALIVSIIIFLFWILLWLFLDFFHNLI